jgi:hypothetical protein
VSVVIQPVLMHWQTMMRTLMPAPQFALLLTEYRILMPRIRLAEGHPLFSFCGKVRFIFLLQHQDFEMNFPHRGAYISKRESL